MALCWRVSTLLCCTFSMSLKNLLVVRRPRAPAQQEKERVVQPTAELYKNWCHGFFSAAHLIISSPFLLFGPSNGSISFCRKKAFHLTPSHPLPRVVSSAFHSPHATAHACHTVSVDVQCLPSPPDEVVVRFVGEIR